MTANEAIRRLARELRVPKREAAERLDAVEFELSDDGQRAVPIEVSLREALKRAALTRPQSQ